MMVMPILLAAATLLATGFSDVAPILENRCVSCHQAGEIAPMPFTSYEEVRPWAKAIRAAVIRKSMPPWHADPAKSVHIANSRALSNKEIDTLVKWVDAGAPGPQGSRVAIRTTPRQAGGWRMGKPDLVVTVPAHAIPAEGILDYVFLVAATDLPQDKWIQAAEWKIDQRAVVHHMNAFIRPPGSSYLKDAPKGVTYQATRAERAARRPDEAEADRRELLLGYEPGYMPIAWENRGKLLRKGSDIVFEIHYTPNGKAVRDSSELGLYFASAPPRERVMTITPADSNLDIPPGDPAYVSKVNATFTRDVELISLQPHMHFRGKAFQIAARYPDGKMLPLLDVPRYDFNWQSTYFLAKPLKLPKGTVIYYTAVFDNSPNNKANPDPTKSVQWGDQSFEEMNIGFTEVAFPADADPNVATLSGTTRPKPAAGGTGGN
jgi:hypothetical protein